MKKYYFKPKRFGWGFVPISVEGWLATLLLLALIGLSAYINDFFIGDVDGKEGFRFFLDMMVFASIFSYWAEKYTDGELKWRWGKE